MEVKIVPFFKLVNIEKENIKINHDQDDIILKSKSGVFPNVRYGLPFGPFYFLIIFIAYPKLWSKNLIFIHVINVISLFLWPSLICLLISGVNSAALVINSYDFAYRALFLSIFILELHYNHIRNNVVKISNFHRD
ncbi:MAG: hypothetical protein CMG60_06350 [Candidatus Marinimicrobia bacterium]|nr:hypothetical protein [Candidatus Neomarinimicrobiota bacterium]